MNSGEVLFLQLVAGFFFVTIGAFWYWIFIHPKRVVAKILAMPPGRDRQLAQFKDITPDWVTYRLLPQPGFSTIWKIQTSIGAPVGKIKIGGYHKEPKRGADIVDIGSHEFWIKRNIELLLQDGFLIQSQGVEFKLIGDDEFGISNTLKANFRNLALQDGPNKITVQGAGNSSLILSKNGAKIGVATYRNGGSPWIAALTPSATALDQAILFYCMLIK